MSAASTTANSNVPAETLFQLPTVPDEFGVLLAPANLRRIDFSALDFNTARRAIIEYIRTYFSNTFNDFVASNGGIMLIEIVAAEIAKMALRGDILMNEAFLPTCTTEAALTNHLALIGQSINQPTPAVVDVQASVDQPVTTDIEIDPGIVFTMNGPDRSAIIYEIYRTPGDWYSKIIIPANKRGVIAYGIEGQFILPKLYICPGGPNQGFTVTDPNALAEPILVTVITGSTSEDWQVITTPIELYGPNDKVVEVTFVAGTMTFRFGDDVHGKALTAGQQVQVRYRAGGGVRGRIGAGLLNETRQISPLPPANAPVTVTFTNPNPSTGGVDRESLADAKRRGPADFATHDSIVTSSDYAQASTSFNHPVYGSVMKAMATIRTSLNANLVEVYVLALGADGRPATPSLGLKRGLTTYLSQLNVLTDQVRVLDGVLHQVDVDMTVVIDKNVDATVVKNNVEAALDAFFDINSWEMGMPLYVSNLIESVEDVEGVSYVDLFNPSDNILPIDPATAPPPTVQSSTGIAFNELIVQGKRTVRYYYELGKFQGKHVSPG
jgi:hypothetical protein